MQVLTASQIAQLKMTAEAAGEAAEIVDLAICHTLDAMLVALTSDRAVSLYRNTWETVVFAGRVFVTVAFLSGCLARIGFDAFMRWQFETVERCQQPVDSEPEVTSQTSSTSPLALPPARERRHNTVSTPWVERVLVTPPPAPVVMVVAEQGKRRRGRPKKTA